MKILVFSDSHGNTTKMFHALEKHRDIELVFHCGDCTKDISEPQAIYPTRIFEAVRGNCDTFGAFPLEKNLQLAGKSILITHGHPYGVKSGMTTLISKGIQGKYDAIVFGHTHIPYVEWTNSFMLVNPGSISRPKALTKPTYAILEVTGSGVDARIFVV